MNWNGEKRRRVKGGKITYDSSDTFGNDVD